MSKVSRARDAPSTFPTQETQEPPSSDAGPSTSGAAAQPDAAAHLSSLHTAHPTPEGHSPGKGPSMAVGSAPGPGRAPHHPKASSHHSHQHGGVDGGQAGGWGAGRAEGEWQHDAGHEGEGSGEEVVEDPAELLLRARSILHAGPAADGAGAGASGPLPQPLAQPDMYHQLAGGRGCGG